MLDNHTTVRDALMRTLRDYVEQVLQTPLEFLEDIEGKHVPAFLTHRYDLAAGKILGRQCVFMLSDSLESDTPATISKHQDALQRHFPDSMIVFVTDRLPTHNRHRLISHHVAFIVPGNQLFLPELAIDLREHFRGMRESPGESLSPASQLLVIAAVLGQLEQATPTELATRFRYSVMSMGRAIAELEAVELIRVEQAGRSRLLQFSYSPRDLWKRARTQLRSPVRKRRHVNWGNAIAELPLAGGSALSVWTDLSEPRIETRAIAASRWKGFAQAHDLETEHRCGGGEIEIETWSYDPRLLGNDRCVDPISLWLSLPETVDDRVAFAKNMLLKEAGL